MNNIDSKLSAHVLFLVVFVAFSGVLVGCGGMADPVEEPHADPEASEVVTTAERGLSFESGFDFERASPVLRNVRRCDGCENLHILHVKSEGDGEDKDENNDGGRILLDEVADGNPVPFPLDEKKPNFD